MNVFNLFEYTSEGMLFIKTYKTLDSILSNIRNEMYRNYKDKDTLKIKYSGLDYEVKSYKNDRIFGEYSIKRDTI